MNASSRSGIVVSLVSVLTAVALAAQAQEPPKKQPPVQGKPAVQASRPVTGGHPPGPGVGRGPQDAHFARGAPPTRNFGGHAYRGRVAWEGGRWHHEMHNGRDGWWWDVGGVWYYYPQPMDGPPAYISEEYVDDEAVAGDYGAPPGAYPPPGAYAPPPAPPPPDPAAGAVGGAIVGGLLGGLLTGRGSGAVAGALVGGTTGAIAASRPGYYLSQGNCYYRYPSGQYVQADPRACY